MKIRLLVHFKAITLIAALLISCSDENVIKETRIVLTPKPGPKPRINGTKIFGVRPGSPFTVYNSCNRNKADEIRGNKPP